MKTILKKTAILAFMTVLLVSMGLSSVAASTLPGPNPIPVDADKKMDTVAGNATNQYTFRNRFQMQIRVNQSTVVDIDCEDDGLADREFEMDLNTTCPVRAEMTIRTENSEIGLTNGNSVQNRNQNQYRYREQFMINVSLNASCGVQARLAINSEDSNATWAYYDEDTEEFVPVGSSYQDGMVVAYTNHFSTWTLLTYEEDAVIPGYSYLAFPAILALAGMVVLIKKKRV